MPRKQPKPWMYGNSPAPKDWYELSQVLKNMPQPKQPSAKKDDK